MNPGHYHLAGVAGVGMSALAQAMASAGCEVTGSDRFWDAGQDLEVIRQLTAAGVRLCRQNGKALTAETRGLVVSTAIETDNPEIAAARRLNVPVLHRAEALAQLVAGRRCLAVTGTSGKSTVTGMAGWILEQAGADPVVVNGAPLINWQSDRRIGNVRWGRSDLWVIEADESDRSLLNFHPTWAVITNASKDHFGMQETLALFDAFRRQVSVAIVGPLDQPELFRDFRPEVTADGSRFAYRGVSFHLPLPGRHNAENALCAVVVCEAAGVPPEASATALTSFRGIHRRLEVVGQAGGIAVLDDYAHNPAKIEAAWNALAPYRKRLIAIWRPHGYRPLASMMDELVDTCRRVCRPADVLIVLPVYDAGGTADRSVRSEHFIERLRAAGVEAQLAADPDDARGKVLGLARPGDAIVTMGARDPALPALARAVFNELRNEGQDVRAQSGL